MNAQLTIIKKTSVASTENVTPPAESRDKPTVNVMLNEFSAGPNPVTKQLGVVNFFWQGSGINNATLTVYGASGNVVNKIRIADERGSMGKITGKMTGGSPSAPTMTKTVSTVGDDGDRPVPVLRRIVGSWDLTDRKGRPVSEGTYLVKGAIKTRDGKRESISLILGVR
jgi:hypothetical protein